MLGQTPPSGHGGKNDEAVKKKGKQIFVPKIACSIHVPLVTFSGSV